MWICIVLIPIQIRIGIKMEIRIRIRIGINMVIRIRIGINTMSIHNNALHTDFFVTEAVAFAAPMFKFLFLLR